MLQYNFVIAHVAGSVNTAADFQSRLEIKPTERVQLKLRNDIKIEPVQVNIESSDVTDEEQVFFTPDDQEEIEEEIWKRKEQSRKRTQETTEDTMSIQNEVSITKMQTLETDMRIYRIGAKKEEPLIRAEQHNDRLLRNLKLYLLGELQTFWECKELTGFKNYERNLKRLIIRDGLVVREYYNETGKVSHYQTYLPQKLLQESLEHMHGKYGKHPGITKMIQDFRQRFYYPNIAKIIRNHVRSCETCIKEKRIPEKSIKPPMQTIDEEFCCDCEEIMMVDFMGQYQSSSGYEWIFTAID